MLFINTIRPGAIGHLARASPRAGAGMQPPDGRSREFERMRETTQFRGGWRERPRKARLLEDRDHFQRRGHLDRVEQSDALSAILAAQRDQTFAGTHAKHPKQRAAVIRPAVGAGSQPWKKSGRKDPTHREVKDARSVRPALGTLWAGLRRGGARLKPSLQRPER